VRIFMYHVRCISYTTYIVFHVSCTPHTFNIMFQLRIRLTPLTKCRAHPHTDFMFLGHVRDKNWLKARVEHRKDSEYTWCGSIKLLIMI